MVFKFLIIKSRGNTGTDLHPVVVRLASSAHEGFPMLSGTELVPVNAPLHPTLPPTWPVAPASQTALLSTRLPCPFSSRLGREVCLLQAEFRSGGWVCSVKWAQWCCHLSAGRAGSCEAVCPALSQTSHTSQGGDYLM